MDQHQQEMEKILMIRGRENTFANELGIKTVSFIEGKARAELTITDKIKNLNGSVHGGCIYALADNVGGTVSSGDGYRVVTLSGSLDFLRPAMNCEKLIGTAELIKNGKKIVVVEVRISDEHDRLIAMGVFDYSKMQWRYDEKHPKK